jgi:hypothetical protein
MLLALTKGGGTRPINVDGVPANLKNGESVGLDANDVAAIYSLDVG